MLRQIKVADLCNELEEKLVDLQYSEDSMRRYRKVFQEFKRYSRNLRNTQVIVIIHSQKERISFFGNSSSSGASSHPESIPKMKCITSVQFALLLNTSTSAHFFGGMITTAKSFGRFPLRR